MQANPNPRTERRPPDNPKALVSDFWKRFYGTGSAFGIAFGLLVLAASSIGGLGLGHKTYLFCVTIAPLTTSSLRSTSYSLVLLIIDWKNLLMLLAYRAEDCPLILDGRSVYPMILTPLDEFTKTSFSVNSQFPPA